MHKLTSCARVTDHRGRQVQNMTQSSATFERGCEFAYIAFESPILMPAVDLAPYEEDDAVMDGWLASLDVREFELILSRLADEPARGWPALEPTA